MNDINTGWKVVRISLLTTLMSCFLVGCGASGPEGYHISGKVTLDGKPVPAGRIVFTPVSSEGTTGYAPIKEGIFDTKFEGGKQQAGGRMIVQIQGLKAGESKPDPENPEEATIDYTEMFPTYELEATLPAEEGGTIDFDVPAEAAEVTTPEADDDV